MESPKQLPYVPPHLSYLIHFLTPPTWLFPAVHAPHTHTSYKFHEHHPEVGSVDLLPTRVLELLNQQKLVRGQMRNSGKSLLGLVLEHEEAKTGNRCPCLLPELGRVGESSSLKWAADRRRTMGWARGLASKVCPPLRQSCMQVWCTVPCSGSPYFRVGSWVFSLFVSCS